jgi:hypothetical protein
MVGRTQIELRNKSSSITPKQPFAIVTPAGRKASGAALAVKKAGYYLNQF